MFSAHGAAPVEVTPRHSHKVSPVFTVDAPGGFAPQSFAPSWLLSVVRPAGRNGTGRRGLRGAWHRP
jgi:hypothetical protein